MTDKLGEAIIEVMNKENSKYFYGYPGAPSGWMIYDALCDHPEITSVQCRSEMSTPFAALATTRLTGQPTICHGCTGPGLINLVPGMSEAYAACAPVIAVVPSTDRRVEDRHTVHEINSVPIFAPITKWSVRVDVPEKLPWVLRRAFSIAANGKPGPVYVEIPVDLKCEFPQYVPSFRPVRTRPDPMQVSAAADMILKSERPILAAGGGAISSGAYAEVQRFAELVGTPVFTSPAGRGIISEEHVLAAGQLGHWRDERLSKKWFNEADLLVSVGCRWSSGDSGNWWWFPTDAKFLQIDIDYDEIGRNWLPDLAVVGDARLVLRDLVNALTQRIKSRSFEEMPRVKALIEAKKQREVEIDSELAGKTVINGGAVVRELNRVFGKDTILSVENASIDMWSYIFPYYKVKDNLPTVGVYDDMNIMGGAIPMAVAAKIVRPDKKVVCTTGDGAFQMYMHEVITSVKYNAPITIVIMNNMAIGYSKSSHIRRFGRSHKDLDFGVSPDYVRFAETCKCYGERIAKPQQIGPAMENALEANKKGTTAILDVVFSQDWMKEQYESFNTIGALQGYGLFR